MQEYTEALGSAEYKMYLNLYKKVELARADYATVSFLIAALRKHYSEYFCKELNTFLKTNFQFNIDNIDAYLKDIDTAERRSKVMKIKLDLLIIEFDAVKNKINGGEAKDFNKQYFTSVLIILSRHNNYRVTKDIFVSEYVEYLKQYNQFCEAQKK